MEAILIGIIILLIFLNIGVIYFFVQFRVKKPEMDMASVQTSIENFILQMEQENEALYQKLVKYIQEKESGLEEQIQILEEKLGGKGIIEAAEDSNVEIFPLHKDAEQVPESEQVNYQALDNDDRGYDKISQLYKQGFSAQQVAKVLQMDRGEVELIINMFKQKHQYK